jgi:hypothetical protein
LALLSCAGVWAKSGSAAESQTKGIDPALLAKAEAGNAETQYQLGSRYYSGDHVRRNYSQAEFWFRKGAEQGDPDSEFMLGGLYHFGQGVPQDSGQAFAWIMKAAEQGHGDAEFFIATCYGEGWGVAKDNAQSMVWLRKGAAQGHFNSQYFLGRAYAFGFLGVPTDYAEAYFWLDLAASEEVTRREQKKALKDRHVAASHLTPTELASLQERARKWFEDHPAKPE